MANTNQQVMQYYQLLQSGVPAKDAFGQAFPNGLPTATDRAKEEAGAQQSAAFGQMGGMLAGALGAKATIDAVTGQPILGSFGSKVSDFFGFGAPTATEAASPAATQAATQAATTVGETGGIGSSISAAAPYLGTAAGAYGLYDLWGSNKVGHGSGALQGAASGAAAGSLGGPVGMGVGALLGGALGLFGPHQSLEKIRTKQAKKALQAANLLDDESNIVLPTGSFKIKADQKLHEVDTSNPMVANAIADVAPLATILSGGDVKQQGQQMAGYFSNAVTNGVTDPGAARSNALSLYQRAGIDKDRAYKIIADMANSGRIDTQLARVYQNSLNNLFGGQQVAPQQQQVSPALAQAQVTQNGQFGNKLVNALADPRLR